MRWLRQRWAALSGHPRDLPDAAPDSSSRLQYGELIAAARGEDAALDARLRQSAERISRSQEQAEDGED
jgi:hypothetical protein